MSLHQIFNAKTLELFLLIGDEQRIMTVISRKADTCVSFGITTLNNFVSMGLVEKERVPKNLRAKAIKLTEKGKKIQEKLRILSESLNLGIY